MAEVERAFSAMDLLRHKELLEEIHDSDPIFVHRAHWFVQLRECMICGRKITNRPQSRNWSDLR